MANPSGRPYRTRAQRKHGRGAAIEQGRRSTRLIALSGAAIVAVYAAGYARTEAAARQLAAPPMAAVSATTSTSTLTAGVTSSAADSATAPAATPPASSSTVTPTTTVVSPYYGDDGSSRERHEREGSDDGAPAVPSATVTPPAATPPAPAPTAPVAVTAPATQPAAAPPAPSSTAAQQGQYKNGTYTAIGYGQHGPVEVQVVVQGGKVVSADISRCGTRYSCSVIAALPGEVVARQSAQVDFVSGATASSIAYQQAVAQALAQAAA